MSDEHQIAVAGFYGYFVEFEFCGVDLRKFPRFGGIAYIYGFADVFRLRQFQDFKISAAYFVEMLLKLRGGIFFDARRLVGNYNRHNGVAVF